MGLFVKICGITDAEAALAAAEAGADAIGFVFHPPSRRWLDPAQAGEVVRALEDALAGRRTGRRGPARVGVFVDAGLEQVAEAARTARLDFVQLHGREAPSYCREVRRLTGCRVIKALRVEPEGPVGTEGWEEGDADLFLLDTAVPGLAGGTGQAFDWALARSTRLPAPVILAGGLTPDNVAAALEAAHPAGVDVSSGVETGGRKDVEKIRAFVARVRGWERERAGIPLAR